MKPLPAPNVPGNTEAERFDNAVRKIFSVSKEELLKRGGEVEAGASTKEANEENMNGRTPSPFPTEAGHNAALALDKCRTSAVARL